MAEKLALDSFWAELGLDPAAFATQKVDDLRDLEEVMATRRSEEIKTDVQT